MPLDTERSEVELHTGCPPTLCRYFKVFLRPSPVRNVIWTWARFSTVTEMWGIWNAACASLLRESSSAIRITDVRPAWRGTPTVHCRNVAQYLNEQLLHLWINRGGSQNWPPRSPVLSPLDFHVWGYVRNAVYEWKVDAEMNYFREFSTLQDALMTQQFFHSRESQNVHLSWRRPF
jgi:hypothetical protein